MSEVDSKTIEKWVKLVCLLDRLTRSNLVSWDESSDQNAFITSVGDSVIKMSRRRSIDHPESDCIVITITDDFGTLVDTFTDEDLPSDETFSAYPLLDELHKKVSRAVRGADEALERIIKELSTKDQDIPF